PLDAVDQDAGVQVVRPGPHARQRYARRPPGDAAGIDPAARRRRGTGGNELNLHRRTGPVSAEDEAALDVRGGPHEQGPNTLAATIVPPTTSVPANSRSVSVCPGEIPTPLMNTVPVTGRDPSRTTGSPSTAG